MRRLEVADIALFDVGHKAFLNQLPKGEMHHRVLKTGFLNNWRSFAAPYPQDRLEDFAFSGSETNLFEREELHGGAH